MFSGNEDISDDAEDGILFGKMPSKEWILPVGDSLIYSENGININNQINLFGLHEKGIENGIDQFNTETANIHGREKHSYYKYYSRYHNCAGYVRFLLEQGGVNSFYSGNYLEQCGVTNPQKYDGYIAKVNQILTHLNKIGSCKIQVGR